MNAIKLSTFQFSENYPIRAFEKNGISWFVAADVCKALDIQNPTQALEKLDDDERAMFNVGLENQDLFDSRIKEVNIINESGLYILILRSRNAMKQGTIQHKFRKWVTAEVLPQIRKTGSYQNSGSLKQENKTTKDDRTPLRQAVTMLVGKTDLSHSAAYKLVHQRFDVASIEDLTHSQIPQAIEYVHRLILNGEVLDKPQNHTVALPEFELVRIAQYLSKTYVSMQLFHELHRALCALSPHFTKRTREEVENNLPLLRGIVHSLQDYSGSLKDPFFNQQFDKSMQFLGRITPQCLAFR